MASYSIIIRNGILIDGTNRPRTQSDIAINNDRIAKIGDCSLDEAEEEIDASERYVVPGFIDITSHSDTHWTLFDAPAQESMLWQGVTTILGGNCGTSLAPLSSGEEIEALQKWVDTSSINVNWSSAEELFTELEKRTFGVNVCTLIGFGTLRRNAVANINAPATSEEIEKMNFLLQNAIRVGAFGLSTSLGRSHEQSAGKNELLSLSKTLQTSSALIKHHLRNEGAEILPALSEVLSIGRESKKYANSTDKTEQTNGMRTHISHFKLLGRNTWESFEDALEMIERARKGAIPVTIDIFPYTRTGSNLYLLLPPWAKEGGREEIIARLNDEKQRSAIAEEIKKLTLHYDKMVIAATLRDPTPIGKTIAQLSNDTGLSPEEIILNLLRINNLNVRMFNDVVNADHLSELSKKEYTAFATDGSGRNMTHQKEHNLPHPRSFGAFPKVLSRFVRNQEILSWEEAIYKMTALPAKILGLEKRGIITKDAYADIAILNPKIIQGRATYENPFQYAEGIEGVIINGAIALQNGQIAESRHGTFLRKQNTFSR